MKRSGQTLASYRYDRTPRCEISVSSVKATAITEFFSAGTARLTGATVGLLAVLSLTACNLDRDEGILMAAGSYGDLAVVLSHDDLRPAVAQFLQELNTPVTFVIREEKPFNIDVYGPDKWKLCRGYKNILLVVRLGDGGPVEKKVTDLLSKETVNRLREGRIGMVQRHDPFARYQFALVVASSDRNSLASLLHNNQQKIGELLAEQIRERIQRRFRHTGLQDDLVTRYWQQFGFLIEIPLEYRQTQVEPEGFAGIEWMRTAPSRGITLAWRQVDDPASHLDDGDYLIDWRREIGQKMHSEDIVDLGLQWSEANLGEIPARLLSGSWASQVIDGGGPFRCYFFADTGRQRIFCLDTLVFVPGEDKLPYFREMQAIAATFSLTGPHR